MRSGTAGEKIHGSALVLVTALVAVVVGGGAAASSSATVDEIALVAGGVRGLEHGEWGMTATQPPLMMYAYGAAARRVVGQLPPEEGESWGVERGWEYARALFFGTGNDPQELLGAARTVGIALVGVLVIVAALYAGWVAGPLAAVLAALMVATTPDVLAHGGVAYNDLPLALALLVSVWALDATVRGPSPLRGAAAGALLGVALCVKMSALALLPIAGLLIVAEVLGRPKDRTWWLGLGVTAISGALASWATLMLLYRGDPSLTLFRFSFYNAVLRSGAGHPEAAYLMGNTSLTGWWFFFPAVFFFKTPAALHGLLGLGAVGLASTYRRATHTSHAWQQLLQWRGRGALLGVLVFGGLLVSSKLNTGFRYALPVLPLLAVLGASGLARIWTGGARGRVLIGALTVLQITTIAVAYPHFLAFTSIWARDQDRPYPTLLDSSVDWGQGLLDLRRFMSDEGVDRVRLSYFGSAMPEAYGVDYVPLPSFFRLEGGDDAGPPPRFTVISTTTLHGLYLQGRDPLAAYRLREPYRVLGHTLFVYDEGDQAAGAEGP